MINIFNLFLTLFSFWLLFAYANNNSSWFYVIFGLVSSIICSLIAWKIKIINKRSNFLFLHLGFYKHFVGLIFTSFWQSLIFILKINVSGQKINPKIYNLTIDKLTSVQLVLLITTINLMPGILFIGLVDKKIILSAFDQSYVKNLNLEKVIANLNKVNDSRLV